MEAVNAIIVFVGALLLVGFFALFAVTNIMEARRGDYRPGDNISMAIICVAIIFITGAFLWCNWQYYTTTIINFLN